MCLIIDANRGGDFANLQDPYLLPLLSWVRKGGKIVSGGKLELELSKIGIMREMMLEWSRRGNLVRIPSASVQSEIDALCPIKSDDPHVVALARLSGARLIVTEDKKLIADLKNSSVVGFRRKIYKKDGSKPENIRNHRRMLAGLDCP